MASTSGRSSRSTLTGTKCSFMSCRDRGVLERLALHHVAPVAGGVADRDEQRLLLIARASQRLLAPRVPVDGVVLVLEQVGGGLVGEAIRPSVGCLCHVPSSRNGHRGPRPARRGALLPRRHLQRTRLPLRPDPGRSRHRPARRAARSATRRAAASTTWRSSPRPPARSSPTRCASASTSPTWRPSRTSTRPTPPTSGATRPRAARSASRRCRSGAEVEIDMVLALPD